MHEGINIANPSAVLSNDQLIAFRENGYLILPQILDPYTCQKFDKEIVQPALSNLAGIDERDPETFHSSLTHLHGFATGEFKAINGGRCCSTISGTTCTTKSKKTTRSSNSRGNKDGSHTDNDNATIEGNEYFLPGVMIRMPNGDNPIPDRDCLDMSPLNSILDQLHNDGDHSGGDVTRSCTKVRGAGVSTDPNGSRNWEWLHSNLGWIHVRFPCAVSNRKEAKSLAQDVDNNADVSSRSWHVDGGHFSPHHLDSREQSVIVLPMIRDVAKGGGNTMVLKRSHIYMAQKLHAADLNGGMPKEATQNVNNVAAMWPADMIMEMAPCKAGDVLLMHPFLVHAAGVAEIGHPMRISFNMGVRWTRDVHVGTIEKKNIHEQENGNEDENDDVETTCRHKHRMIKKQCRSPLEEIIDWSLTQKLLYGSTTILDVFKEE